MTQEVWNEIAGSWYGFRHHTIFRTELSELAKRWQKGRLLNIGCGHGPDFLPFVQSGITSKSSELEQNNFELYGIDFSVEMLRLAQKYAKKYSFSPYLALADARRLPFCDESFDWVIAVAGLHHIDTGEGRSAALTELKRVLKPGGEAFITVWNHGQPRFRFKRSDTMVDWKQQGKIIKRYYHLFSYGELKEIARRAGLEIISVAPEAGYHFPIKSFSRNICLLVKKNK